MKKKSSKKSIEPALAYRKNLKPKIIPNLTGWNPTDYSNERNWMYVIDHNVYLNINGHIFTDEIFEFFDKEKKQWENNQKTYSFQELIKIFPEAIGPARRGLKAQIKEYKNILSDIDARQDEYQNNVINKAHFKEQNQLREEAEIYFNNLRKQFESKIRTATFSLSHLDEIEGKVEIKTKKGITENDILRAKQFPITSIHTDRLIRHGSLATGKCPFHKDNDPSFTVYLKQNSWWCFGCNTGGSVVDYVMKRDNCDFLLAVKKLI